jgi:hypothetical protein
MNLDNTILYLAKDQSKQFVHILKNLCPKLGIPIDPNLKEWTDNKNILRVYDSKIYKYISWWSCHNPNLSDEENIKNIPIEGQPYWNKKIIPIYTLKDLFCIIGHLTKLIPGEYSFKEDEIKEMKEIAAKPALNFRIIAPDLKNDYFEQYKLWVKKLNRDKSGRFAPKLPKVARFQYESKNGDEPPSYRKIKVIEIDNTYIKGYDLEDLNAYKIFKKDRIIDNHIEWDKE